MVLSWIYSGGVLLAQFVNDYFKPMAIILLLASLCNQIGSWIHLTECVDALEYRLHVYDGWWYELNNGDYD